MRAYARECQAALAAVRLASRAARSMQKDIVTSKAAFQKQDVSPVTAADFMVQVLVLGALTRAFPGDRFIAEETGSELLAAGGTTRSAVLDALANYSGAVVSEADALATLDLGRTGIDDDWSRSRRTWVLDPVDGTSNFAATSLKRDRTREHRFAR